MVLFKLNQTRVLTLSLLALGLWPSGALADQIVASQTVDVVELVDIGGGMTDVAFVPANTVPPGSELRYAVQFQNVDTEPAADVTLVMPVPQPIIPISGSAETPGVAVSYSIDQGQTYDLFGALSVTDNGVSRPATWRDVTHIRWTLTAPLAAGAEGEVSYRGVLE